MLIGLSGQGIAITLDLFDQGHHRIGNKSNQSSKALYLSEISTDSKEQSIQSYSF